MGLLLFPGCQDVLVRLLGALLFAALVVGCAPAGPVTEQPAGARVAAADWPADTGVYGTYNHFGNPPSGPPAYLCGVAYDLRYHGAERLDTLEVAIRYPDGFLAHVSPNLRGLATGWQHAAVPAAGPGSLFDAARIGHASGSAGSVCASGPPDLDALRGTIVKVGWHTASGDHEHEFHADDVRGEMTLCAGYFSSDGQVRVVWGLNPQNPCA